MTIVASDWAEDFAHKPENFKLHALRRLYGSGNDSPKPWHTVPDLPLGAYYVDEVGVDGRTRYDPHSLVQTEG